MGSLFKTAAAGGTPDLIFQYLLPNGSEFTDGVVVYRGLGLSGDYNNNGVGGRSRLCRVEKRD